MLNIDGRKVYLACGATDMRKNINGLSVLVQDSFNLDPFEEVFFVFCNRQRNRIKILVWDEDGFWLLFKRLERGHFKWPSATQTEETMCLTPEEFEHLLGSSKLEKKLMRKEIKEREII